MDQDVEVRAGVLVPALCVAWAVYRMPSHPGAARPLAARLSVVAYRALLVVLAISIPVEVTLSHIRAA